MTPTPTPSGGAIAESPARRLRLALGLLWLVDGLLKLQPQLAQRGEEAYFFSMAAMSTPGPVARAIIRMMHAFVEHRTVWLILGAVEILIGTGVIIERTSRWALAASAVWALSIWVIGEGFAGLAQGTTSLVTGFPGAALLDVLLAVLLWPHHRARRERSVAARGLLGDLGGRCAWGLLWGAAAGYQLYQVRPAVGPDTVAATLFLNTQEERGPLRTLDLEVLHTLTRRNLVIIAIFLTAVSVLIGYAVLLDYLRRVALLAGVSLTLIFWVVGQNLGDLPSGSATDVGTGPLWVLLVLVLWPIGPRIQVASPGAAPDPQSDAARI